jgi:hypothetical protein
MDKAKSRVVNKDAKGNMIEKWSNFEDDTRPPSPLYEVDTPALCGESEHMVNLILRMLCPAQDPPPLT